MLSNSAVPREYGKFRQAVIQGEIPVNEFVSQQMNLIDDLIKSPEYYYDDTAIDGFIKFVENEMTTTEGDPVTMLDSFKLWAEDLLAWYYYREDKSYDPKLHRMVFKRRLTRLRNKQYLIVGRGAAKTMYASFIQAYFLTVDPTTTDQIVTAPTMKQSNETMSPIQTALARAHGPLFKFMTEGDIRSNTYTKVKLASTKKGIENFITNSIIEVRPMKIDKLQGLRSKINTVDEWLSGKITEDPIEALEQGASKIDDYVIVSTSSEGTVRDGVGDTVKMELINKLKGQFYDPHTSIWYYRLDDVAEVANPDTWLKANPNLGITVSYDTYQRAVETMESTPAKRNDILAKRFGIPVEGFTYFFTYEETKIFGHQSYDNMECTVGMDLSQGDDFTAFTFLFPLGGGRFGVKTLSFVSSVKMSKVPKATQQKYDQFVKEGTLRVHDEVVLNMEQVFKEVVDYIEEHQFIIMGGGYDPYNSDQLIKLWTSYFGDYNLSTVRQGARTESVPMGEIKNLSATRNLIFDEHLMSFAMGNAIAIEDNNGNLKLAKNRSDEKIDNVAALIDAWVAYRRNEEVFDNN